MSKRVFELDLTPIIAGIFATLWLNNIWFGLIVMSVFSSFGRNPIVTLGGRK